MRHLFILLTFLSVPNTHGGQEPILNGRIVTATYTESEILIDADLNESAWERAEPAEDFIQRDPSEGEPATEWTEVRVLYDNENLYIGVYCHDRTPDQIVISDITRDFEGLEEDHFGVVLDTFNDDRNGFVFVTTPRGGQLDIQIVNEGRDANFDWDGVWHVEARIHESGWTAEFAIPFKTLRFSSEHFQTWGIQFFRRIRHKNEVDFWAPVPRRYGAFDISRAGELRTLEGVRPGRNLKITPFALAGVGTFPSQGNEVERDFDGGVDIKYGLTPSLTLDLSLNTDFSHVEVDNQQVNLTRFPLFFPEKRDFFLENAGFFEFGETYRFGPSRIREANLFFSRRIGRASNGEPLPILGGARLTGRAGPYYLGFTNIQTRSQGASPANNFTVARFRRDFLRNSDAGVMFINRQSGRPNDYNRSFGADVNFRFFQDLKVNALLAKTETPGRRGNDGMTKVEMLWKRSFFHFIGSYLDMQKNFNPEVGFIRRPGRRILRNQFGLQVRVSQQTRLGSFVRDMFPTLISEHTILPNGETETKFFRPQFRVEFHDGSFLEVRYIQNFERLTNPFAIRRNISIPSGDYRFNESQVLYFSDKSKLLSLEARYIKGNFFSGKKTTLRLAGGLRSGYKFSTSVNYQRNDVDLPEGSFATDLLGWRIEYSFNSRMRMNALIQYNSDTNQVSSNIRFRLIHRPLSDLFIVYNQLQDVGRERTDRVITLKYTHLLNF